MKQSMRLPGLAHHLSEKQSWTVYDSASEPHMCGLRPVLLPVQKTTSRGEEAGQPGRGNREDCTPGLY